MSANEPSPLHAEYVLEYTYRRSVGPLLGGFLAGLRDGHIHGVRTAAGRVLVPPPEADPDTGASLSELVDVGDSGVVTTWSWVATPRKNHPLQRPFAWALIRLDGADVAMLHVVDGVRARWKNERIGGIGDIECFTPEGAR
jgi:uncharacterized OB-fold protein